MPKYIFLASWI